VIFDKYRIPIELVGFLEKIISFSF